MSRKLRFHSLRFGQNLQNTLDVLSRLTQSQAQFLDLILQEPGVLFASFEEWGCRATHACQEVKHQ